MDLTTCCFNCKSYYHANPDDDMCSLHDCIVYFDSSCDKFDDGTPDIVRDEFSK